MRARSKLRWNEIDAASVRAAAETVRALHAELDVSVELDTQRDLAIVSVRLPKACAIEIQHAADPDVAWPAAYPDRGHARGDSYHVCIAIRRDEETSGPYRLEVCDEDDDNDPAWGVAITLGNHVAKALGGTPLLYEDEEEPDADHDAYN